MFNGMRKIGQNSAIKRSKENLVQEEELNFDKDIEETLEEENNKALVQIPPLRFDILVKNENKLDEDEILNYEEDTSNIQNINELPKLIMKPETISKQIYQMPVIKLDQEIELNPATLDDVELPSDTLSRNSVDEENIECKLI